MRYASFFSSPLSLFTLCNAFLRSHPIVHLLLHVYFMYTFILLCSSKLFSLLFFQSFFSSLLRCFSRYYFSMLLLLLLSLFLKPAPSKIRLLLAAFFLFLPICIFFPSRHLFFSEKYLCNVINRIYELYIFGDGIANMGLSMKNLSFSDYLTHTLCYRHLTSCLLYQNHTPTSPCPHRPKWNKC